MKYNVTQLEGKNEPVNSVLGNYFIELEPRNYQAEESSSTPDTQPDLLRFSRVDEINCKIVDFFIIIQVQQNQIMVRYFSSCSQAQPLNLQVVIFIGVGRGLTSQWFSSQILFFLIILYTNKLIWLFILIYFIFLFCFSLDFD